MKNKRLIIILATVATLLSVPLIAMQFTNEVKWTVFDFVVMGILLSGTGLLIDLVLRKVTKTSTRILVCGAVLLVFLITWAELAVGVFGTPFAGS
ncbi:MAG: hypothetical protein V4677_01560 [Bacteroidota bacterium]